MELTSLFQLILALLGILLVLVLLVAVVVLRMPRLIGRRRATVEPPRRVLTEEPSPGALAQSRQKLAEMTKEALRIRDGAHKEADQVRLDAERLRVEAREVLAVQTDALNRQRAALDDREGEVGERDDQVRQSARELAERREANDRREAELTRRAGQLEEAEERTRRELERLAGLSTETARHEVLTRAQHEARLDAVALARDIENEARATAEQRARAVIVESIQRLASEQTSESVVSTVPLPSEEMKGRIIGREGRNIRAFEQITGVNVMIDDTPETVLLSCFDPVRRETARLTLTDLISDGRIHPARIEDVHARSVTRIRERCLRAGEDAVAEMCITDLHPDLVATLGALQYRTSYGQNVLKHLLECGHLAAMMAAELGLHVASCKRAAFLHDIGKALTHEVEGSHALVGAALARRLGEADDIAHAIEAHHNEVEPRTVEAVLTQAADAISGSRPGARRESLEVYVQRLERLEKIAAERHGVDKVFAMQAGREIRVMVAPDQVTDTEAHAMARAIAKQIESELTYPGSIRITVVRESRAIELAH